MSNGGTRPRRINETPDPPKGAGPGGGLGDVKQRLPPPGVRRLPGGIGGRLPGGLGRRGAAAPGVGVRLRVPLRDLGDDYRREAGLPARGHPVPDDQPAFRQAELLALSGEERALPEPVPDEAGHSGPLHEIPEGPAQVGRLTGRGELGAERAAEAAGGRPDDLAGLARTRIPGRLAEDPHDTPPRFQTGAIAENECGIFHVPFPFWPLGLLT